MTAQEAKINEFKCFRCGHSWIPRQKDIKICPSCKSTHWDKPKQVKRISDKISIEHNKIHKEVVRAIKTGDIDTFLKASKRRGELEERYWKIRTRHLKKESV